MTGKSSTPARLRLGRAPYEAEMYRHGMAEAEGSADWVRNTAVCNQGCLGVASSMAGLREGVVKFISGKRIDGKARNENDG
jgi:hypothetical protein